MTQETTPRNTIGMAGVFWVASELARRNWFAFPTVRNQKGVDIIATKEGPVGRINARERRERYEVRQP